MTSSRTAGLVTGAIVVIASLAGSGPSTLRAQQPATTRADTAPRITRLVAEPARIALKVGDSIPFKVTAYDARGNVIQDAPVRVGGPRRVLFFGDGYVKA